MHSVNCLWVGLRVMAGVQREMCSQHMPVPLELGWGEGVDELGCKCSSAAASAACGAASPGFQGHPMPLTLCLFVRVSS